MNKQGFTLLELLMVILVVGILASFAIPRYMSFRQRAYIVEADNIGSAIIKALEMEKLENGDYPGLVGDNFVSGTILNGLLSDYIDIPLAADNNRWFVNGIHPSNANNLGTFAGNFIFPADKDYILCFSTPLSWRVGEYIGVLCYCIKDGQVISKQGGHVPSSVIVDYLN